MQKLINMDYQDPIIYLLMGNIWFTEKDTAKGMSYIEQGRGKFPTDKDLINTELNVYLAQGKQDVLLKKLDVAFLMHQFGTHGIGKAADRRFRSAVSRLQWD